MTLLRSCLTLLCLASLQPLAIGADRIKEVNIHPGETAYLRFEVSKRKIQLVGVSREPEAGAQVVFALQPDKAKPGSVILRVENNLPKDLVYAAELHSLAINVHGPGQVSPVVAGKIALESYSGAVDKIVLSDFKFAR